MKIEPQLKNLEADFIQVSQNFSSTETKLEVAEARNAILEKLLAKLYEEKHEAERKFEEVLKRERDAQQVNDGEWSEIDMEDLTDEDHETEEDSGDETVDW